MRNDSAVLRRQRRQWYKAEARQRLGQGQTLFNLILAALVLIMLTVALTVMVDGFFALFDFGVISIDPPAEAAVGAARMVLLVFGLLFLLMPLWYGLRGIALSAVCGAPCETGQLFAAFNSSYTIFRVWRASLWIAWRIFLSTGLLFALWWGVGLLDFPLRLFLLPGAVLLTPVLLLPLMGTHLLFTVMHIRPELGVFAAIRLSCRLAWRSLWETLTLRFSFIGWFALSFVSAGVMLVLYVLPYFILADTAYAQYLLARAAQPITISTEEKNHVQ